MPAIPAWLLLSLLGAEEAVELGVAATAILIYIYASKSGKGRRR